MGPTDFFFSYLHRFGLEIIFGPTDFIFGHSDFFSSDIIFGLFNIFAFGHYHCFLSCGVLFGFSFLGKAIQPLIDLFGSAS